jgi:hypothetical protein
MLVALDGVCLDRLLKPRFARRRSKMFSDLPPPCGGIRSLSGGEDGLATDFSHPFRASIHAPANS